MEDCFVETLFSTPIYQTKLNINLQDIKLYIKTIEYSNGSTGYFSNNHRILDESVFFEVKSKIEHHLNLFLFEILKISNLQIKLSSSWINLHQPNDYAPSHVHANSFYSGILYLDIPDGDSGKIYFSHSESLPTIATSTLWPDVKEFNILNSKSWQYDPSEGLLLLFPSHVHHGVLPNKTNKDRYSLAFNYFVNGKLGNPGGFLELNVI